MNLSQKKVSGKRTSVGYKKWQTGENKPARQSESILQENQGQI